jgi:hypothetical protein
MQAVAGPFVTEPQWLKDEQRFAKTLGLSDSVLQGVVPKRSTVGDHPIEDVSAVGTLGVVVGIVDSHRWDHSLSMNELTAFKST